MGTVLLPCAPAATAQLAAGGSLLEQGDGDVPGTNQADDELGAALAAGDFDHDGRLDLAIGLPGESDGLASLAGRVVVAYGSAGGLAAGAVVDWSAEAFSPLGFGDGAGDRFGSALASGDFDDDGYDDLAIGAPGFAATRADLSVHDGAGAVFVLYGGPGGLSNAGQQVWHQNRDGLAGLIEANDRLGSALAAGDLDGDGYDDLAIGVPYEDVGDVVDAGGVNLLYGSASGLTTATRPNVVWTQSSFGPLAEEEDDRFGSALAIGDFWADGAGDLVIGVPDEDLTGAADGGFVFVARGLAGSGLTSAGATLLTRGSIFVVGEAAPGDRFGAAFAVGEFDGDGVDDLAIGSPGESWSDGEDDYFDVGAVHLLRGAAGAGVGTTHFGRRLARASLGGVVGLESFGDALVAGDFDHDGLDEVAVGAPGDEVGGAPGAGAVYLLDALTANPPIVTQVLSQAGPTPDLPSPYDAFGASLAAGDFDGNRFLDLATGAPHEDDGVLGSAGVVHAFPSLGLFTDDFETGNTILWSDVVPD
jgi:hypothetical protein